MIVRLLPALWLLTAAYSSSGQSFDQWVAWGDAAMADGDHYGASRFYAGALDLQPGKMDLQWSCAEACRLSHQYEKAADLYEKVEHKDHRRTYPDALFHLAEMRMSNGEYREAEKAWRELLRKNEDPTSFQHQRAQQGLKGCAVGLAGRTSDSLFVEHLPDPVNTYDSEFGGRYGPDSLLYLSSLRGDLDRDGVVQDTAEYHVAIFRSREQAGGWAEAEALPDPVNGSGNNANVAWSLDGRFLYFTHCPPGGTCHIVASERTADGYGPPQELEGLGSGHSTQPMVARMGNEELLFFASTRGGGPGGMDLWVGKLKGTNVQFARPVEGPLNTPGNESCPFYDSPTQTLFFSSDFHAGLGGYDIFTSHHGPLGFESPVNPGAPINGPANDLYPAFDARTGTGLLTSNRVGSLAKKGETCCNDLYRWQLKQEEVAAVVEKPVVDTATVSYRRLTSLREKLPLRLYFHNDEPGPRSWDTTTAQDYAQTYRAYTALLPDYRAAFGENNAGRGAIEAFFRDRVDHGFAQLNDFIALLHQALDEGQKVELVVRGFASPLAKSDYNRNLSLRRIQSMINYLARVESGALKPYLDGSAANGGRLTVVKAPFGEDRSAAGVSDVLEDLQNSVYSVAAASERRIEIEQVLVTDAGVVEADAQAVDLGVLAPGQERTVPFTLRNTGDRPVTLLGTESECGCTTAELGDTTIPPGGSLTVDVHFNGRVPAGRFTRSVTVRTDSEPGSITFTIFGTMTE